MFIVMSSVECHLFSIMLSVECQVSCAVLCHPWSIMSSVECHAICSVSFYLWIACHIFSFMSPVDCNVTCVGSVMSSVVFLVICWVLCHVFSVMSSVESHDIVHLIDFNTKYVLWPKISLWLVFFVQVFCFNTYFICSLNTFKNTFLLTLRQIHVFNIINSVPEIMKALASTIIIFEWTKV